jgi:hypothetical protein
MKNGLVYNRNKKVADDLLSNLSGESRSSAKLAANIGALNRSQTLTKREKMAERRARARPTPLEIVKEESGEEKFPGRSRSNTMADLMQPNTPPTPEV